ncbi:MAG: hypothetical protein M3R71_00705 [Actinomycetota bacterium]|nr:hypothetical protein [Actinomycetota bacterium]
MSDLRPLSVAEGKFLLATNFLGMRPAKPSPVPQGRRPPEPVRPEPAQKTAITLLAARARRRRYRALPPTSR